MRPTRRALLLCMCAISSAAYGQGQVLNRTLQHDGLTRSYSIYVPRAYTGEEAWPLVLNMHFLGGNASAQMSRTGMNALADTGNFLVAYPNATVNPQVSLSQWNEGTRYQNGPDDVGFIDTMLDELEIGYHINSSRIYATGMSAGGMMSYYLGSELSGRIAAIAAVAGQHPANPTAPRPMPVLHFFGTADPSRPYNGGYGNSPPPLDTVVFPAVADVIDAWRDSNNSVGDPTVTQLPNLNTGDGSTVTMIQYLDGDQYETSSGDKRPAEVLFYRIDGGGHAWPGGMGHPGFVGNVNRDINATDEIWKFFSRHELPAAGSAWGIDADGNWSQASNWKNGIVRNAVDAEALFRAAITQPRTVSADMPITVGRIDFESSQSYTVAGPNSITFDVAEGSANINVHRGSHTISAPVILTDNTVISVWPAASSLSLTGGLDAENVSLVKAGAGTLTVNELRAAGLTINGGKVIVASAGSSGPAVIGALTIAGNAVPTATLDLADNTAIIKYNGASPSAAVRQQIISGRGGSGFGATWNGQGITSSAAAAAVAAEPESRSVGYAENASLPLGPYVNFRGQPVDDTSLLIAYTRTGDANLDGIVDDADVTIVSATYAPGVPQPHWALGDFDYNGFVDDADVTLLGVFYDPSAPPLVAPAPVSAGGFAAVPEPGTVALVLAGLAAVLLARATKTGR